MKSELKWSKVTNQKYDQYKRFVEYFFALNNTDELHFKCMIVDNHQINHKKFSDGNKENGFYKFYYQLLLHSFGKEYYKQEEDTKFIIHLDHRCSSYPLMDLKNILNSGIRKKYQITTDPFRSIEPRDSKLSELIQINDIILGAIGFQKNGFHLIAGSRKSKIDLAEYIAKSAGLSNLSNSTFRSQSRFSIWNFKLNK